MLTQAQIETVYEHGPQAVCTLVVTLQAQIDALTARVKELEARLNKDSHNSSKPPSSDGLAKKPVSLRPATGRKPGGQKGHPGRTLTGTDSPDAIVAHTPAACACCGKSLETVAGVDGARRQVVDLPPLALVTTEHRVQSKVCPHCACRSVASFPDEARQSVQYGPRLKALGVYLRDLQLLPYARIAGLFTDLFGAAFSPATLVSCQQSASERLGGVVSCIRQGVTQAPVAHFDETGLRVRARLHWLHSASTSTLTYYAWHKRRGKEGMDKADVLPHFAGVAVHDGWASYQRYACRHALCNAHHLRELTALYEQDRQPWANTLRALLVEIKRTVERVREQGGARVSPREAAGFAARYRSLLQEGFAANPPPATLPGKRGRPKQNAARNLLTRLQRYERETLRFLYDLRVPFDNNLAERDIRMVKVQQKVSGTFRSEAGADAFCRIRSYLATLRKQGQSVLPALEHVFRGNPLCPQIEG